MKTVLLAYEREQDLNAVEALLKARGHQVTRAKNGVDALEQVRRDGPSVVVSDVLLPKLDGFALCRRIKEDPLVQHIPVLLHTLRFDGPKYEAFAAEVGAEKFFARGTKLEAVAEAIEGLKAGSGTMRMPAIVPELLEKREQDRKRLAEVEQQARDLEHSKTQLVESQRMLREEYGRIQQEASDRETASAATIRELQGRVRDLESLQQRLADSESRARGVAADSQAEVARVSLLESRLVELQAGRARAQATATDSERVLSMLPLPTWICDMETLQIQSVSDSAAALFDITPDKLRGRALKDVWNGFELSADTLLPAEASYTRPNGDEVRLELRRQSISYGGRPCWLMIGRDVTGERGCAGVATVGLALLGRAQQVGGRLDDGVRLPWRGGVPAVAAVVLAARLVPADQAEERRVDGLAGVRRRVGRGLGPTAVVADLGLVVGRTGPGSVQDGDATTFGDGLQATVVVDGVAGLVVDAGRVAVVGAARHVNSSRMRTRRATSRDSRCSWRGSRVCRQSVSAVRSTIRAGRSGSTYLKISDVATIASAIS